MRIRQVLDKITKGVDYHKYLITLPKKIVENSGLFGKELVAELNEEGILLKEKLIINHND